MTELFAKLPLVALEVWAGQLGLEAKRFQSTFALSSLWLCSPRKMSCSGFFH